MADIEIKANTSPWMNQMEVGHIYTVPVATMEGRILLENNSEILKNGQIATEFIGENPTGSFGNIESLTSPDGRVLGTISSIDRIGEDLYKNIHINGKHNIFESGIKYFD